MSETKKVVPSTFLWDSEQKEILEKTMKQSGFSTLSAYTRFIFNRYIRENKLKEIVSDNV